MSTLTHRRRLTATSNQDLGARTLLLLPEARNGGAHRGRRASGQGPAATGHGPAAEVAMGKGCGLNK